MVIGGLGPVIAVIVPPIRMRFGDGPREKIPLTYPSKSLPKYINIYLNRKGL